MWLFDDQQWWLFKAPAQWDQEKWIEMTLSVLREAWMKNKDLRLMQLLMDAGIIEWQNINWINVVQSPFYVSDYVVRDRLKEITK